MVFSVRYVVCRSDLVIEYQPNGEIIEIVRGTEYKNGIREMKETQGFNITKLLNSVGGPDNLNSVWTEESISEAKSYLIVGYILSLVFTLLSTMLIVEVIRNRRDSL